jgi:hypothetical protein
MSHIPKVTLTGMFSLVVLICIFAWRRQSERELNKHFENEVKRETLCINQVLMTYIYLQQVLTRAQTVFGL